MQNLQIRTSTPADLPAIKDLYTRAFPEENLIPVVTELLDSRDGVLSLVGVIDSTIVVSI